MICPKKLESPLNWEWELGKAFMFFGTQQYNFRDCWSTTYEAGSTRLGTRSGQPQVDSPRSNPTFRYSSWEVNPIKKRSYFWDQLFDPTQMQIKVPTLFVLIADNSRISIKIILYKAYIINWYFEKYFFIILFYYVCWKWKEKMDTLIDFWRVRVYIQHNGPLQEKVEVPLCYTASFIKPYRDPVNKCTRSR